MVKGRKLKSFGFAGLILGGIAAVLAAFFVRSRRPRRRIY